MSTTKAERLLTLLKVLLDTESLLSAAELRRRVPGYAEGDVAFRRTFERDKVELGAMLGHPIRSETIPGTDPPTEGYRIRPEDAYLRDPDLTSEERRALGVAASAVRLTGVDPTRGTMKVGASPSADARATGAEVPADAAVVSLFQAVAERRIARFAYHGEEREVQPFRLRFTKGRWYLSGYDAVRDAERQFRVDRIESEVTVGAPGAYEPPATVGADALDEPWAMGDGPTRPVRVRVDAARADAARRGAPGAETVGEADGSVVLTLEVRNTDALRGFVLGFGEAAEVLDPPDVRADVVAWLTGMAEMDQQ